MEFISGLAFFTIFFVLFIFIICTYKNVKDPEKQLSKRKQELGNADSLKDVTAEEYKARSLKILFISSILFIIFLFLFIFLSSSSSSRNNSISASRCIICGGKQICAVWCKDE